MGVLVASMRLQYLTGLKCDLEYKIQLITQAKMNLMSSNDDLMQVGTDYDSESPIVKTLQQRQAKMKLLEQRLDQQMNNYQNQLRMVMTEYESARGMLDRDIQSTFRY
ncbi:MAG: hypothetical protein NC390_06880 [Fusobacterium sp.]|nr:hypothetical protein [Fusobacterium sp.]